MPSPQEKLQKQKPHFRGLSGTKQAIAASFFDSLAEIDLCQYSTMINLIINAAAIAELDGTSCRA
jgi:hypothetical protein